MSVYAISDLHGRYDVFKKIKEEIKENDRVICLGDCADRGYDGLRIIQEILNDNRFTYIKGNHEDLLVKGMKEALSHEFGDMFNLWTLYNGGAFTYDEICKMNIEDQNDLVDKINSLPEFTTYNNTHGKTIWLSHAGFSPDIPEESRNYLWDRNHFLIPWPENHDNVIEIHGHTPVDILSKRMKFFGYDMPRDKVAIYCDGHKIDIDLGTVWTGVSALLNLDTFDVTYITV